ncbi:MAG: O-antigen ligase family protein [Patescibacteria group bacterium]
MNFLKALTPQPFRKILLFLILIEILSFLGYFFPAVNAICFWLAVILALWATLNSLENGFYLILLELVNGVNGYYFHFSFHGVNISLRIALFLIVLGVWLHRFIFKNKFKTEIFRSQLIKPLSVFAVFILWGFVYGLIRGHSFDDLFFDFNNWLYFALIFVFFDVIRHEKVIHNILHILAASLANLGIKTMFLFYVFSHGYKILAEPLYSWMRPWRLGEITALPQGIFRVFIQSQIYCLIGLFLFLIIWLLLRKKEVSRIDGLLLFVVLSIAVLLVSFSRSFWLATILVFFALLIFLKFFEKNRWKEIGFVCLVMLLLAVVAIAFLTFLLNVPLLDKPLNYLTALGNRTDASGSAILSRKEQFLPLMKEIMVSPIVGSGFGATITYRSFDPRAVEKYQGIYTTYAFEWGYLDMWLKFGLAGLLAYLYFIFSVLKRGWQSACKNNRETKFLIIGLELGLLAILVINIFTPYLNHPLGIGYLILCAAIFDCFYRRRDILT